MNQILLEAMIYLFGLFGIGMLIKLASWSNKKIDELPFMHVNDQPKRNYLFLCFMCGMGILAILLSLVVYTISGCSQGKLFSFVIASGVLLAARKCKHYRKRGGEK